mmetsp:Transcript_2435/g.3221  ORF Transcript_2435/g.3221 Transcript_2435/m.3221 type:complete len:418 (+) Transcript_2435:81-1334(+)|eukprot:CAMPEP_0194753948 /NCGR_PEP_ID=MMETSP0323_2-20130528/7920_1 /TAXON_ID=2866 ORGANISM="Crypthecodinium cohnii, Strain Seligo" /NCGR_SAMPLE_ID=MMETSP0323_2 /ASSEMBLY_ACC=CAM_ASM_000346 /LENGTH=417 /DNA_ID=CAMNT_0039672169 /DNA_START=12 /DNA_END=1265 /DNA_ORIENTATION=+
MAESESTCRWLCTCLCENYLDLVNKVLFVVGLVFFLFAAWICFMDPLSDPSWESMQDLGNLSKTKWAALAAGPLILIAACLGISFAKQQNRAVGCGYMVCILLALILQFVVVSVSTGGILTDIQDLVDVTLHFNTEGEASKKAEKLEEKMAKAGKAEVISKTFRSWAKRWNNPDSEFVGGLDGDYECRFTQESASSDSSLAADNFITMVESSRRLEDVASYCTPKEKTVKCGKSAPSSFAKTTSEYCMAKASHEKEFTNFCSACITKWWDLWDMEKLNKEKAEDGSEQEKVPKLQNKFEGDPGAAYCRCMSRFVDSIQRHYPQIKLICNILAILELILLFSTIWLMMCGPDPEESSPEIEMNLGQQPASGAPQRQTVICPENALPGTPVMVTTNDGRMMQAIVPEGVGPGMPFQIEV